MFSYCFQRFQCQVYFASDVVVVYALWGTVARPGDVLAHEDVSHWRIKQRLEGLVEERRVGYSGAVDKQRVRLGGPPCKGNMFGLEFVKLNR